MSTLFISHSSRDNEIVAELKGLLMTWGYGSVFLDYDPEVGIPPGRDWEQELYHQLRTCRAVLVLCSSHSMASHWCFAEITHAKSLGKHVFPLRVAECEIHPVLTGSQVLDLTDDREEAYRRLEQSLKNTLGEGFPWDRRRAPYPGLLAFQEEDAAVFFGRSEEVHAGLDALERLRRYGGGRALMALGASGSGKSSLVRAGWIPRLRRDSGRWLILKPFRPLDRPWRELAISLAGAFADVGRERSWRELQKELERAAAASVPSPEALLAVVRDLRLAGGQAESKVLLTLDQAEELLGNSESDGAQARFAPLLQAALESAESPLMVIGTLRTDLLAEFQHHVSTRHLVFDDLRIGPMTSDGLLEVIEGPAQLADLDLEPGLAEAILADAETEDALPLLAFALRELYERFGADRKLTLEEYRDGLGGLGGSVAQVAESVIAGRPLSVVEQRLLRDAMLSLVRIDEEGRYARRSVRLVDLPEPVHGLIQGFVEARLLVTRGAGEEQSVEVAHEALFHSWNRLRAWLDEDREFLLWRKRLNASEVEWRRTGRHASGLLQGPALDEGRRWLGQRGGRLEAGEREFLADSVRRAALRKLRWLISAGVAAAVLALVAVGGIWLWRRAEVQRARAEDIARVAVAGDLMASDPTRAAQVLLEVKDPESTSFAVERMREVLGHRLAEMELIGHRGPVRAATFSPDGSRVVTASWDGTARIWRTDGTGGFVELAGHGELVTAAAFSPGGHEVLTVARDGTVRIWPTTGTTRPLTTTNPTELVVASFGPAGKRVLAVAKNGTVRVWRVDGAGDPFVLGDAEHFVLRAAFNAGGDRILTVARDGAVSSWRSDRPGKRRELGHAGGALRLAEFSPLADRLLTVGDDGAAVRRLDDLDRPVELLGIEEPFRLARFSRFGDRLLSVTAGEEVRVWDLAGDAPTSRPIEGLSEPIDDATFGPRGDRLSLISESGAAWLWSETGSLEELKGHAGKVRAASFSFDGERLVTASEDRSARIWKWPRPVITTVLREHEMAVITALFSATGDRMITASLDGTARIWPIEGGDSLRVIEHDDDDALHLAAFDARGERVLTVSRGGSARLWPADAMGVSVLLADSDGVETAAFDPKGERVATVSFAGRVRIWRTDLADEPVELGSHDQPAFSVSFAPDGERLVTGSVDETARVWSLGGGQVDLVAGAVVLKAVFSPDGRRVVTASEDATARVWNADGSGEPIRLEGHANEVVSASFSPDGRRVVTASNDFEVRIWSLDDPNPAATVVVLRHEERVTSASFSADGRYVVSASGDGTARVWRSDGSLGPLVLQGHVSSEGEPARVTAATFSPDGTHVLTASEDSTARLWLVSASGLREAITSAVRACLEPVSRRDYLGESMDQAELAYDACQRESSAGAFGASNGR